MVNYVSNTPDNTYVQTDTGGNVATAVYYDEIPKFVASIDRRDTPILNKVMSNEEVMFEKHRWGQSVSMPLQTNLNGALDSDDTAIPVATGTGYYFQKWMTATIVDVKAGTTDEPDWSTAERIWCSADPTADGITVGTRGSYGSSASAHSDGALVIITGTAEPLNNSHSEAPRISGSLLYNYPQRFAAKLTADKRAQNQPTFEIPGNRLLVNFAEEIKRQKILLEKAFWHGQRHAGDGSATNPSMMGGIDTFLTTNSIDLSGELLTIDTLDDALREIRKTSSTNGKLELVGSIDDLAILDTQINPIRRADSNTTDYTNFIRKYNFRGGTYMAEETFGAPRGKLYLLDFSRIKIKPFKGLNWHKEGQDGDKNVVEHDVVAISGDFTLEVQAEASMAVITNYVTDLNQYSTLQGVY